MGWTNDQEKAIYTDTGSGNLLVSAAAGSGKTAVLVERVLQKILSGKSTVDRLLIVTFTEAAASEMKQKIVKRLFEYLNSSDCTPSRKPLIKNQIRLTQTADIMTIDGFCNRVVLNNFHNLGIDPNLQICDNAMAKILIDESLASLFDSIYKSNDKEIRARFNRLTDVYAKDRSNDKLGSVIEGIYRFTESFSDPVEWLNKCVAYFDMPVCEQPSSKYRMDYAKMTATRALRELDKTASSDESAAKTAIYEVALGIANATDWDEIYAIYKKLFDTPKKRSEFIGFAENAPVSSDRDTLIFTANLLADMFTKGKIEKTAMSVIFSKDEAELNQPSQLLKTEAEDLVWIVSQFISELDKIKNERNLYEFSDIEHMAYRLFNENEVIRSEYRDKYDEILIDEYQDTNMLQDTIFHLISNNNIFMVGDLKQSIYRFRKGDPYIFKSKAQAYEDTLSNHARITLSQNFRSRQEVLNSVNDIFEKIMSEPAGDVDYTGGELIVRDNEFEYYPSTNTNTKSELHYIGITKDAQITRNVCEARYTAQKIKGLLDSDTKVYDKQTNSMRKIEMRDIVILENSIKYNSKIITDELARLGINSYVDKSSFFDRREISVMMSVISVIDNSHNDIHVISVMRSPICGFTDNELATIRIHSKESKYFIDAVTEYSKNGDNEILSKRCYGFISNIRRWRDYVRKKSVAQLIWSIYEETCFYDMMGALEEGEESQTNLRLLYERAKQYENAGFRGLFNFVKYLKQLEENETDMDGAKLMGENHNVVRIMTIHKSKGLEFPYVFLLGAGMKFSNKQDISLIRMHKKLGLGLQTIHYDEHYMQKNHSFELISRINKYESISERMRLLYVALTRPREKLYVVIAQQCNKTDPESIKSEWGKELIGGKMLPSTALNAKGFFSWLCPSALVSPDTWDVFVSVIDTTIDSEICTVDKKETYADSDELRKAVYKILDYKYPHFESSIVPSRTSVTQLKELSMEDIAEYEPQSPRTSGVDDIAELMFSPLHPKPEFLLDANERPANEIGTLYHLVMAELDLEQVAEEGVDKAFDTLINNGTITCDDLRYIDLNKIKSFFDSDLAKRMMVSKHIYRERQFQINIPASMYNPELNNTGDTIILQGIIDCFFEEDDGFVLLDYKTDKVRNNTDEIKQRYTKQLELYKTAIEKLTYKPVKESYLYLFDTNEII